MFLWLCVGFYLGAYATMTMAQPVAPTTEWKNPNTNEWETSIGAAKAGWESLYPYNSGGVVYHIYSSSVDDLGKITYYFYACNPSCGSVQGPQYFQLLSRQTCPANYHLDGDMCVQNQTCVAGSNRGYYSTGFTTTACIDGCSYTRSASGSFSVCSGWSDATGWASCFLAQNGESCSIPNGAPSSGLAQCPVGQCPGTINGSPVCVPCTGKTDVQSTGTKTTTNADGSTTTTTTTTNSTSQGGTTTTTTTTVTSNTPAGGGTPTTSTTTSTDTKPTDSFCIENPSSPLCKQSSFGGSCGAFSCDGDAIQCAMAREQHARNCTMFDIDTAESTLGKQVAAGNDPQASNYPTAPAQQQTVNLATAIDTTNPFAGGCIQDKSFTIMTTTLVIPFSNICPYLEAMGQIVLAFSLLMAARIAFSGV